MKRIGLVVFFCAMIAFANPLLAQNKRPLVIALNAPPADVTVTRDTPIEFHADLPENEPRRHYVLCCRDLVRDFGDFTGKILLRWDPAKEPGDYYPLIVWRGNPGVQGTQILRIRLHVVASPPVVFVPMAGSDSVVGNVEVNVRPGKTGDSLPPVDLYVDGKPVGLTTDPSGKAVWNATTAVPGEHTIQGVARLSNGSSFTLEAMSIRVVPPLRVSLYAPGGQLDLSKINGEIPVHAFLLPDLRVRTVTYLLDGTPIGMRSAAPLDRIAWNPAGIKAGRHRLKLAVTDADNRVMNSPETSFTVVARQSSDGPWITELPRSAANAVPPSVEEIRSSWHIVAPQTSADLLQPWVFRVEATDGRKPTRVTFYRDGQILPADPESAVSLLWDPRSEQPGDYAFRAEVVGDDGKLVKTPPVTVHIPVRVALTPISDPVVVSNKTHTVTVKADLLAGLAPRKVDFWVDGKESASRLSGPFDQMELDTTDVETGPHRVQVQVTDTQGAVYTSQWIPFTVDNPPLVARRKQQAEEDRKYAEEAHRVERATELYRLRKALTGSAIGGGAQRVGHIGSVYGLTVLQETVTNRLTGASAVVYETGATMAVMAAVLPGSGQVSLLNQAALDSQTACQVAAEYCKRKVAQMGYTVNWSATDMKVQMDSALPVGGPSAGAAYAVSLVSAALKMPIDSSVALTGEIGPNGEVQAVGGIVFKGEAALSNPRIHTLIVPADWISQLELDALYRVDPALFTNKRIIYAHNMEEVLRQSLIGYDRRYEQSEALVQDALRAFLNEEYDKSLQNLTQARNLTPENVTILAWIDVVKRMKAKP